MEDSLGDDLSAAVKEGSSNPKENGKEKEGSNKPQGSNSAPMGSKCVKIALQFEDADFDNQAKTLECANLLKAMELDEEEVEVEEIEDNFVTMNQEEDETYQLPEEWVFNLTKDTEGSQFIIQMNIVDGSYCSL